MRVTVIGSSDAFNSSGRFHSCYLLDEVGTSPIMIDFGATALVALRQADRSPADIGTIAITHLHGDHVGGIPFLFIDAMYNAQRTEPLRIIGPKGLEDRLEAFFRCAYPNVSKRERPFPLHYEEIGPGDSVDIDGVTLTAFAADHQDAPEVPLCLRFSTSDGRSVAFSGDTQFCPGLYEAADGVGLLVAECTGLAPPAGRHMTWEEWREALPNIRAHRVLLTHLHHTVRDAIPRLLAEAPAGPELAFADDREQYIIRATNP
ncbi:MAG: ribonuclease BN (tRNA processing enzyme) [Myxococcota bacterium]|jgi:ribonuclease BN (tRNA processing enzyme)